LYFLAIDTAKTVLQIDSVEGFRSLMRRVKAGRVGLLYSGAFANAIASILGHYPWVRFYCKIKSSVFVKRTPGKLMLAFALEKYSVLYI
jgi:hypothetical protein